jgi:hypothetical protein
MSWVCRQSRRTSSGACSSLHHRIEPASSHKAAFLGVESGSNFGSDPQSIDDCVTARRSDHPSAPKFGRRITVKHRLRVRWHAATGEIAGIIEPLSGNFRLKYIFSGYTPLTRESGNPSGR